MRISPNVLEFIVCKGVVPKHKLYKGEIREGAKFDKGWLFKALNYDRQLVLCFTDCFKVVLFQGLKELFGNINAIFIEVELVHLSFYVETNLGVSVSPREVLVPA